MPENKSLKKLLIIQSFAPLFLILAVKNFDCKYFRLAVRLAGRLWAGDFRALPAALGHPALPACLLEAGCTVWVLYGLLSVRAFRAQQTGNFRSQGETLEEIERVPDSGTVFFTTYILPMVLDDIETWPKLIAFTLLMGMLCGLLWKTNLYYQNPVLTLLGYDVVSFKFVHTELGDFQDRTCVGITRGRIRPDVGIKRQYITDNVFLVYEECPEAGRSV